MIQMQVYLIFIIYLIGLSPKYSFPVARDNILACYQWLVTEKNISPSKIAFGNVS